MRIVKPYATLIRLAGRELLNHQLNGSVNGTFPALQQIEAAARVSHRSEDGQTDASSAAFIKAVVLAHGDWSVVEHVTATVEFYVDRGITHEIVRHRLFSYTQESTRFVNYEKKMPPSFIYPKPEVECPYCLDNDPIDLNDGGSQGEWVHRGGVLCRYDGAWMTAISTSEQQYRQLVLNGWRPQEARSVFPNALASKLIMTGNLRCWRHFFQMRSTKEAHPQMRQVVDPLLAQFQANVPLLFDDLTPGNRQIDNLKLPC